MDLELKGKKAIVSAASRGVGRFVAERLLAEGAEVSICGRRAKGDEPNTSHKEVIVNDLIGDGVNQAVEAMSSLGKVHGFVVDCGYYDQVEKWVHDSAEAMGGIDIVVSNASALGGIPRNNTGWDISYNVDMMSAVAMWETAYPYLKKGRDPAFVQIATISAVEHHAFVGSSQSYGAMNAALIAYTGQIAQEFMAEGIRANTVSPGPIFIKGGSWDYLEAEMPDYFAENIAKHPAKRMGNPQEVADLLAYLASPRASWVVGENIVVDGGYTKAIKF